MIPSTNSKLLVSEDWKKIYQSFRNADFKSYDFETLRRTMIQYLQENYPEDFNDYIESSEYIALIDLIAYLGQNLSFRIDLNARENFLETAQRRDSVLRLAQLISYSPARNVPAHGFLKITAISTTDTVVDANGVNLANTTVGWNDVTNSNWYQQFMMIMNSMMPNSVMFGKPYGRKTINGILTEQYQINSANTDIPVYSFSKSIGGTNMNFEIVSSSFLNSETVYEEPPKPGNAFGFIYQNDNQGSSSINNGFFVHFRQGTLGVSNFAIDRPVPNEIIGINITNINNTDVWLWQMSADGKYNTLWSKVDSTVGNNIIYNSLSNDVRNVFSVTTRTQDQIDLNFADGSFGNLPKGKFSLFYRQSNGTTYSIKPEQMSGIGIVIPYYNKNGQKHQITLSLSLQYVVSNSSATETNANIQSKAPQSYYTQNRMVTGEDYNIVPLTLGSDIIRVKSIARTTSGLSKYYDLSDVTGKYSQTNIFGSDGIIYQKKYQNKFEFKFETKNDIFAVIKRQLEPIVASTALKSFYLDTYPRPDLSELNLSWSNVSSISKQCSGYFTISSTPLSVGKYSSSDLRYVLPGALLKFIPPVINGVQQYFDKDGNLTSIKTDYTRSYIWSTVLNIIGDGSNNGLGVLSDGTGPIILNNNVSSNATLIELIPNFINVYSYAFENELVNICINKENFGLSYDLTNRTWNIISNTNLDYQTNFSFNYHNDLTNTNKDSSWVISFVWDGDHYVVKYRLCDYIFESEHETAFFLDSSDINYDFTNGTVIKDKISILGVNTTPIQILNASASVKSVSSLGSINEFTILNSGTGYVSTPSVSVAQGLNGEFVPIITNGSISSIKVVNGGAGYTINSQVTLSSDDRKYSSLPLGIDHLWQIDSMIVEPDGYIEPKKVRVSFYDYNNAGQIVDPDTFLTIVAPENVSETTGFKDKFIYFEYLSDGLRYQVSTGTFVSYPNPSSLIENGVTPTNNIFYYFYDSDYNVVNSYSTVSNTWVYEPNYFAYAGRKELKFHYIHNSGENKRIDPSKTNIIDIYLLTSSYDTSFRSWLTYKAGSRPLPPTSQSLENLYGGSLELQKTISDEIIYHHIEYVILFGSTADASLQATFKAVKNPVSTRSSNSLTTDILTAINNFFALENWEFGQSFHFSELSTYVMNIMTPDITNFVIVPKNNNFGGLYEVTCQSHQIFVNGATASDIQIISAVTPSQLLTTATITTNIGI